MTQLPSSNKASGGVCHEEQPSVTEDSTFHRYWRLPLDDRVDDDWWL